MGMLPSGPMAYEITLLLRKQITPWLCGRSEGPICGRGQPISRTVYFPSWPFLRRIRAVTFTRGRGVSGKPKKTLIVLLLSEPR